MPTTTRHIGLSLGADLCWPICFEEILDKLNLEITMDGQSMDFKVERVTIEPYDLRQPVKYDVVLDRLTHWYNTSREWIKKAVIMDDLYVFNNPFSIQSMEKHTAYAAMMRLGMPVPTTWMIPPKEYEQSPDLELTLSRYAKMFNLGEIARTIEYPMFMKPYDGGAWVGVTKLNDVEDLARAYDASGKRVMHLQEAIDFDLFVRCVGVGPQVNIINYDPGAPLHQRYKVDFDFVNAEERQELRDMTLTINTFFGWDFNSCEALREDGTFYPIDFANACPDSQVTSLHFHFPWVVKAKLRWAIFCAATDRPMRRTMDWDPYYEIAAEDIPYREKLKRYAGVAADRLDTERFEEFCRTHLTHFDEVAWEVFGGETARRAVRQKVEFLFPKHEWDEFTEHFWGLIQFWRKTDSERMERDKGRVEGLA